MQELREEVLEAAKRCAKRGPGDALQSVVLGQVAEKYMRPYGPMEVTLQQAILTCWHDLFREGELSWGYNLDNPDAPFFHVPDRTYTQSK